jgi:integrase
MAHRDLQPFESDHTYLYVWENPGRVIDRNGRPVYTTGTVWLLQDPSDNINLNWDTLHVPADLKDAAKDHVAHAIEALAPKTAHQIFKQLKYCFSRLPPLRSAWNLSFEVMESLLAQLRPERKDWHFHYIRKFYQWCEEEGIPGFSGEVATRLYELKLAKNPTGERVMSRDVEEGPLSHDEHFLVRQAVKERKGSLQSRVCVMLEVELGARPVQLVALEEQDFVLTVGPNGEKFFSLNVPRAKQRTVGEPEKKSRKISAELGGQIEELIGVNHSLYGDCGPEMPILCAKWSTKLTEELERRYELHMKVVGFAQRIRGYTKTVGIISPRTGKILKLEPRRLRYTYFTMLAEQGASRRHLSELADHSNDSSIEVYVGSTSTMVERLNIALGKDEQYARTMKRFTGEVVSGQAGGRDGAAIEGSVPTLKNLGGIGVCGANFLCNLYPPLSCYVCPQFQAWKDGPHEEVLLELESYVRSLVENSGAPTNRIPYQLVDVMTAVRQLLERIKELENDAHRAA